MSTQLERARHRARSRATTPRSCKLRPDVVVVGNVMTRGEPVDRSAAGQRHAVHLGSRMAGARTCCATRWVLARRGHARQDHDLAACSRGSSSTPGLDPGFLIGGVPAQFRRDARGSAAAQHFVDRGRRVRHGVLRQAREVRALPAAHRDPQQPRVRPRRHLSRTSRDPAAVPSAGAHGAAQRPRGRERRRRERGRACSRWAAGRRSSDSRGTRRRHRLVRVAAPTGGDYAQVRGACKAAGRVGDVRWQMLGRHNAENALAAIARRARTRACAVETCDRGAGGIPAA